MLFAPSCVGLFERRALLYPSKPVLADTKIISNAQIKILRQALRHFLAHLLLFSDGQLLLQYQLSNGIAVIHIAFARIGCN